MKYWHICIEEAFEEAGIKATQDQINTVVSYVEGGHENYGLATGRDCIPDHRLEEIKSLKNELKKEQSKIQCFICKGNGWTVSYGPHHSASSQCWKCNGVGKVLP